MRALRAPVDRPGEPATQVANLASALRRKMASPRVGVGNLVRRLATLGNCAHQVRTHGAARGWPAGADRRRRS